MAQEIINTLRSSSTIRVVDPGTYTITLANLSSQASETVTAASIKRVMWSTNGSITIVRNSVPVFTLHGSGDWPLTDMNYSASNNSTQSIVITITTGGSAVLEVSKDATYSPTLTGM
jgi:hypothetical protein